MLEGPGNNEELIFYGADSTVTITPECSTIVKCYHSLSESDVQIYFHLHRILSQEGGSIECSDTLQNYFEIPLQSIKFRFLDLGDDIVSEGGSVVHAIPYIPGDTLDDGLHKHLKYDILLIHSRLIPWIERSISGFVAEKLGTTSIVNCDATSPNVSRGNIKVIRFEDSVLHLIVTDIGSSIRALLEENRCAIDRILSGKQ